jgi:hypothetical protein
LFVCGRSLTCATYSILHGGRWSGFQAAIAMVFTSDDGIAGGGGDDAAAECLIWGGDGGPCFGIPAFDRRDLRRVVSVSSVRDSINASPNLCERRYRTCTGAGGGAGGRASDFGMLSRKREAEKHL